MKTTYQARRGIAGFLFVLPWIIGLVIFFIQPMILIGRLAFTNMSFADAGYVLEPLEHLFDNFKSILSEDAYYPTHLIDSVTRLLYEVPFVVLFSLFSAVILNQKFHGRAFMRVIFFLPVVIGCGLVMDAIANCMRQVSMTDATEISMFDASGLVQVLLMTGLPQQVVTVISTMVNSVADLVWNSAIQTLVFLVALLSVPQSYYEVAKVEGAKAWETFWKVTFPMVTPYVLALTVYSVIDSFTNTDNVVMKYIVTVSNTQIEFSKAAAMAWLYFLIITVIIVAVFLVFRPFVFQREIIGGKQKGEKSHGRKK